MFVNFVFIADSGDSHVSSFRKKRQLRENTAERRHQEKLARLDKFNELFAKMVDKM